jgi:hypothetical protein
MFGGSLWTVPSIVPLFEQLKLRVKKNEQKIEENIYKLELRE